MTLCVPPWARGTLPITVSVPAGLPGNDSWLVMGSYLPDFFGTTLIVDNYVPIGALFLCFAHFGLT